MNALVPIRPTRVRRFRSAAVLLLVSGLAVLSCSKKGGGGNPVAPPSGATATVSGVTLGGGGQPLANATITVSPSAGATATSNSFGYFSLKVPANTAVAITASHGGFADHPLSLTLATGDARAVTFVMTPFGGTTTLSVSGGGKVTDLGAKTAITLPGDFTSGTSFAVVSVTGIDPTTAQSLGMPGTIAAENSLGTLLNVEPATAAEVRIGDGADADFPLVKPATLEMHLPPALAASVDFGLGDAVPCFRYDDASGHWKFEANGQVAISSVDGQKCVALTITHLSWYLAGFLNGSAGCVSGTVSNGGVPVAGATVEAFPGGIDVTKADGTYRVNAPADAAVQLVATRPGTGTVTFGSANTIASPPGGLCTDEAIALSPAPPPPLYLIAGQLLHGRDGVITRDEVFVSVADASTVNPTPLDGCTVKITDGITTKTIGLSTTPGLYSAVTGFPGAVTLQQGHRYTLTVDVDNDGHAEATATALLPGQPTIDAPAPGSVQNPKLTASWSDLVTGTVDTVIYIGSFTSDAFSTVPSQFALNAPANSFAVGTGIGQPQYFMPNDSLEVGGSYTFRLWATNGPVRYPVGATQIFTTPNVGATTPGATNVVGWFSAISMADSVTFTDFGGGTRPGFAMRATRPR